MRGPNCHASSVIAAYWPGTGSSLATIDLTQKRIGVIQYFLTHSVELLRSRVQKMELISWSICLPMYDGINYIQIRIGLEFQQLFV